MRIKNIPVLRTSVLIFISLLLTGCAKIQYMDQLLTLKGLSDEQARMGKEIDRRDARFERLVAAVRKGAMDKYKSRESVLKEFGEPVYASRAGEQDVWVYRYAARFFDSPKVCLYWDQSGQLSRWEYQGGRDGKIEPETPQKI